MNFPNFPGIPPLSQNQVIAGGAVAASGTTFGAANATASPASAEVPVGKGKVQTQAQVTPTGIIT